MAMRHRVARYGWVILPITAAVVVIALYAHKDSSSFVHGGKRSSCTILDVSKGDVGAVSIVFLADNGSDSCAEVDCASEQGQVFHGTVCDGNIGVPVAFLELKCQRGQYVFRVSVNEVPIPPLKVDASTSNKRILVKKFSGSRYSARILKDQEGLQ